MLGNVAWTFCAVHPTIAAWIKKKKNRFISILWFSQIVYALPLLILMSPRHLMGIDIDIKIGSKVIRVIWYGSVVDGSRIFSSHCLSHSLTEIKRPMIFPDQWIYRYSRIFHHCISLLLAIWCDLRLERFFRHLFL